MPYTGNDTVLDAIHHGGGLLPSADRDAIRLVREYPPGSEIQVLPIDYEQIAMGTDRSTNYRMLPGDRLVAPCIRPSPKTEPAHPQASAGPRGDDAALRRLEARVNELDAKLDRILARLEAQGRRDREPALRPKKP